MGNATGSTKYRRKAYHAGSWYADDAEQLEEQLKDFMDQANDSTFSSDRTSNPTTTTSSLDPSMLRAIITPHAGYAYSGKTAGHSFLPVLRELRTSGSTIRRILLLHPSHHLHLPGRCAVSNASILETPVGNLKVDDELRNELLRIPGISTMTKSEDEHEHSGEMQLPFLALCQRLAQASNDGVQKEVTVTPLMVGSLNPQEETRFGQALCAIIAQPDVLTVVSSDFCHWGQRFRYQPTAPFGSVPIHKYIESLDHKAMDLISAQKPGAFAEYLKETRNTICGRHPIAVWLRSLEHGQAKDSITIHFQSYAQSSPVKRLNESSVSYAAATATQSLSA